ncbi:hypothetical protein PABG_12349 [Paracoccidioides brasiliensis Pb03]|uniref:Uncharacterized protein n=1 Tax=Paracoccidioides brasiliensis TaxID=121759 RepID=A0A1D2JFT7_PARBR|nr:hypothetical protein PABG_12349 [Paracoccidioides brasiliensis Pb03]ODH30414.1 hypothetical protein ACO22_03569 [Paracoccidioides brasiliensis]
MSCPVNRRVFLSSKEALPDTRGLRVRWNLPRSKVRGSFTSLQASRFQANN